MLTRFNQTEVSLLCTILTAYEEDTPMQTMGGHSHAFCTSEKQVMFIAAVARRPWHTMMKIIPQFAFGMVS